MLPDDPQSSLIERLVSECVERQSRSEASIIEDVCREHPDLVSRVREVLANSGRVGLRSDDRRDEHRLGNYRLLGELGRGGQAVVYLAEDTRLRRQVALKVLKGFGPLSENVIERFRREAEVTSKLDHPGICTVYDTGVDHGVPYIAMRLVHGTTLASRIAAAKDPGDFVVDTHDDTAPEATPARSSHATTDAEIRAIAEIIEKTARALHVAHEAGVIHRDIKPGNVIVTEAGQPVVLDFGLARDEDSDLGTLTQSGDLFGTPAYMSPEQLMAQRVRLDRRTDVYSLGVTLYECLALRQPFEAPTREAIYQAIQHKDPPDLRKLNPRVSRDLKVVVETALEKDRDKRYATAQAFAEDLRRARCSEPITAKPVGPIGRTLRFAKRRPAMATLIGVLMLAVPLIAGLGGFLAANWDEIKQQRQRAIDDEVERHLQDGYLELADGSTEKAITAFDQALVRRDGLPEAIAGKAMALIRGNRGPDAVRLLEAQEALLASEPGFRLLREDAVKDVKGWEKAASRTTENAAATPLGMFLVGQRDVNLGEASYRFEPGLYKQAVDSLRVAVAGSRVARLLFHGMLLRAAGRAGDRELIRTLVPAVLALWPDSGWAHVQAGVALSQIDDRESGVRLLRRAIDLNPKLAAGHSSLGRVLVDSGEFEEAVAEHLRAIELEPNRAQSHNNLGVALRRNGRTDEAIAAYRKAIEIAPNDAVFHSNLGVSLKDAGKIDEAIAAYKKAIALDPKNPSAFTNLGVELSSKGKIDEAMAAHRKAIELDPAYALPHVNLGAELVKKGLFDDGIAEFREAIAIDPRSSLAHNNLGFELKRKGKIQEAVAEFRVAIELDPSDAAPRTNLGPELGAMGQVDEAITELRKAVELAPKSSMAHHNLAVQLRTKCRIDEAITEWKKAVELDPQNLLARNGLAVGLINTGRIRQAIAEWRKALEVEPTCAEARGNLELGQTLICHEESLDAVLGGRDWPVEPADLLEVSAVAAGRGEHALAARMWARAFAEGPELTTMRDPEMLANATYLRELAAISAVLAASGEGVDGPASADLRANARRWLTDALAFRSRPPAAEGGGARRRELRWTLERWKSEPKLTAVREARELAKVPEPERQAWEKLWKDVDAKLAELSK